VAVCSLEPAGLVDAAARHLIPRQFADVGAMLDGTSPDLLDIVTPPDADRSILEEAARRGIDVICQKPLGGDSATRAGGDCARALQRHVGAHRCDGAPLENAGAAFAQIRRSNTRSIAPQRPASGRRCDPSQGPQRR
jgi:Oxidoreductase family, NAD-binding Rossmann fold